MSKKLVVKNGLDATVVMKKCRAKNRDWVEKRRAPLYNVMVSITGMDDILSLEVIHAIFHLLEGAVVQD